MIARYRTALANPGVPRLMSALLVACLLTGMMNLALLLAVERATGSYASAGVVAGCFAVGLAFGAPLWGRMVDRHSLRGPLAWAAAAQAITVGIFLVTATVYDTVALLAITACLAGGCTPPYAAVTKRVMTAVPGRSVQRTLFAMTGLFTECVMVVGPLAVGVIVLTLSPLWAVAVAAAASITGSLVLRGCGPVHDLDRARAAGDQERAAGGARWNRRQVRILVVITLGAFAIGALQVSIVAHAQALGTSEGMLVAAAAAGGVLASFLYGGLHLSGRLRTHLVVSLGLYGLLILTLLWSPGLAASIALLFLIGAATGPADAVEAMLIGRETPAGSLARAFAVVVTANWVGVALGSALAGALIETIAIGAGVTAAGLAAIAGAMLAVPPVRGIRTVNLPDQLDAPGPAAAPANE